MREVVDYEEVCCLFPLEQICSDFLPWIIRKVTWTQGFSMLILASTPTNNRSIKSEILERYLRDFTCAHTELPALPASITCQPLLNDIIGPDDVELDFFQSLHGSVLKFVSPRINKFAAHTCICFLAKI